MMDICLKICSVPAEVVPEDGGWEGVGEWISKHPLQQQ